MIEVRPQFHCTPQRPRPPLTYGIWLNGIFCGYSRCLCRARRVAEFLMENLMILETEIDTPPKRIAFCGNQLSRISFCGRAIFDNDIESVELITTGKPIILCGSCVKNLITFRPPRAPLPEEPRIDHRKGAKHYHPKSIPPGDFLDA